MAVRQAGEEESAEALLTGICREGRAVVTTDRRVRIHAVNELTGSGPSFESVVRRGGSRRWTVRSRLLLAFEGVDPLLSRPTLAAKGDRRNRGFGLNSKGPMRMRPELRH